ncbi:FAD-dependent monooxygenase terC [Colletotrichum trifolii]|uniref:FAD-dependent monooxygenase terC n=1 Tax=Colletotrichum trifolii TaxID=5466 RepID=A0A4R8QN75_COLTR|nr:FAD-dependent monooxygenase terC [Colletotrichum trifolii]
MRHAWIGFVNSEAPWGPAPAAAAAFGPLGKFEVLVESRLDWKKVNTPACLVRERSSAVPAVTYLFGRRVTGIGQDDARAWVDGARLEADYVVGCDGGQQHPSTESLWARELSRLGWTWDEQLVSTNVYYDFERFGHTDSNFILDPDNWFMAAKITKQGLWRVTYGEVDGLTRDEMVARQPDRFRTMLPGRRQPHEYTLAENGTSPYTI